jgi:hypothetical protein
MRIQQAATASQKPGRSSIFHVATGDIVLLFIARVEAMG